MVVIPCKVFISLPIPQSSLLLSHFRFQERLKKVLEWKEQITEHKSLHLAVSLCMHVVTQEIWQHKSGRIFIERCNRRGGEAEYNFIITGFEFLVWI